MSDEEIVDNLFRGIARRIDVYFTPIDAELTPKGMDIFSPGDKQELLRIFKETRRDAIEGVLKICQLTLQEKL